MERFPWHPPLRARSLVIAAVTALTLAALAAVGMAATLAPGPNGCPTNKSLKTAPIADLAPPARTQIEAFDVLSGPINDGTQTFTMKVRVGSTCSGIDIKGASVYVTAVPYNQFTIPDEELTGDDGTATLVFRRDANFPASDLQQQLTLFIRATKPGEDPSPVSRHDGSSRCPSKAEAALAHGRAARRARARPAHPAGAGNSTQSDCFVWSSSVVAASGVGARRSRPRSTCRPAIDHHTLVARPSLTDPNPWPCG